MLEPLATPYSQPRGIVASAIALQPGVYVPPDQRLQLRSGRATPADLLHGDGPIPWIDAFLAATPAAGIVAFPTPPQERLPRVLDAAKSPEALPEGDSEGLPAGLSKAASAAASRAESAALTLEVLANRVRSGELTLAGYDPALGDAAALVTALAAVLGVRLAE